MPSSEDFALIAAPMEERDWTPQEWRVRKHFSKSTHLKLKKAGLAPEEEVVMLPGFNLVRITPQARARLGTKDCGAAAVEGSRAREHAAAGTSGVSRPTCGAKPDPCLSSPAPSSSKDDAGEATAS